MAGPLRKFGLYLNLVYAFPASVCVGVVGGHLLDKHFGTAPWLAFAGFLIGLGAGFQVLFATVKMLRRGDGK